MAGNISLLLIAIAAMAAIAESRVIPAEPISVTLDAYGNSVMFLREKRTAAMRPYPHRTMMFTSYYRPIRRTDNGGQATGVFAQGNAVSGKAFFGGVDAPHLKGGPEPIEESEVSSAEAQAAPAPEEEQEYEYHRRNEVHRHQEEEQRHHHDEEEQLHRDEPHYHQHHHQDPLTPPEHRDSEQVPLTTEIAQPMEKPTEVSAARPKVHHTKKTHKTPVTVNADDDDDNEDEVDEEDDEPIVPFVPFKNNRHRQSYPNLNNFFPMVFSFPRPATRAGSSESLPGTITAIANSYSTGKGGVASSVATAYGGSSTGKKRRPQTYKE